MSLLSYYNPIPRLLYDEIYPYMPIRSTWRDAPEQTETGYIICQDVPGFKKENLTIEVGNDNYIRVNGESHSSQSKSRVSRKITQKWYIPRNADPASIMAQCEDGVLTITMNKINPQDSYRRIAIV